jgi:shikimate dehydrogenase
MTRLFGVIGDPIDHTLSPTIHNAAFSHLKLDCVYLAFNVKPAELRDAIRGIRGLGIHGLNVTMPHKKAVINLLDKIDPTAKSLGVVNTILNYDGRLCGFNTDGVGALKALEENGITLSGKRVLLLGAGGAAKAIALALTKEVEELYLLNRTLENAENLKDLLKKLGTKVTCDTLSPTAVTKYIRNSDIVVNATSVGMYPNNNQSLIAYEHLNSDLAVMDIVYSPVETRLVKDAKTAGARVVSGVDMLVHQGAASFEIWTGRPAPVDVMRKAAMDKIANTGGHQ